MVVVFGGKSGKESWRIVALTEMAFTFAIPQFENEVVVVEAKPH